MTAEFIDWPAGPVYLAERADDEYRKRVAIKLIERGMDTDAAHAAL